MPFNRKSADNNALARWRARKQKGPFPLSDINGFTFINEDFTNTTFIPRLITNTIFSGCNMSAARFVGIKFVKCAFIECNLLNTNFRDADLTDAIMVNCKCKNDAIISFNTLPPSSACCLNEVTFAAADRETQVEIWDKYLALPLEEIDSFVTEMQLMYA